MKRFVSFTVICALLFLSFASPTRAALLASVQGRQFLVSGFSTGTIPTFAEVFVFNEDGSFIMKKIETYGQGQFYEYLPGVFYSIFTTRAGVDMQYVEVFGLCLNSLAGYLLVGAGSFMIDYRLEPLVFYGIELFQPEPDQSLH